MSKTIRIYSSPAFSVPLSLGEIEALMVCATHHYDGTCQAMAQPVTTRGTVNGTLVIWKNSVSAAVRHRPDEPPEVSASFRDLDLCLKLMEHPPESLLTPEQQDLLAGLRGAFHQALQVANDHARGWTVNSTYEPGTRLVRRPRP